MRRGYAVPHLYRAAGQEDIYDAGGRTLQTRHSTDAEDEETGGVEYPIHGLACDLSCDGVHCCGGCLPWGAGAADGCTLDLVHGVLAVYVV